MLYEKFIRLVEEHAEQLTHKWVEEVRHHPSTKGYHDLSNAILGKRIHILYRKFGDWLLSKDLSNKHNAEFFIKIGQERALEGLKASEVIYAIILARTVLWHYVIDQGIINTTIDMHQALEFYHSVNNFFDKAVYFVAMGFESVDLSEDEKIKHEGIVDGTIDAIKRWVIPPHI